MDEDEYTPSGPMFDLGMEPDPIGMNWDNMTNISDDPAWDAARQSQGFYTDEERNALQYDYGAPDISAEDFLDENGDPLSLKEVVDALMKKFPKSDRTKIANKVKSEMPRFQAIPQEEKDFARQGFKKDVYGISKMAGKAGAQMRGAYGSGMGSSMRGAYSGAKDIQQQFKQAEQGYAQDMYGLKKQAMGSFESDLGSFITSGGVGQNEGDVFRFQKGGKVPNKKEETFLDILAKIPSAGGS
jgi:hypothetical protein